VASAAGGSDLSAYQAGALACMLPLAFGAAWLVSVPGITHRQRVARVLTVLVVISSPVLRTTLQVGHPEDVVAAVLATMAVVAATNGQARLAAVLLGLSIGAKEWALVALVPVMIALPGKRRSVAVISGGLVLLLVGLPWLGDPAAVDRAVHAQTTAFLSPLSPLWPLADPIRFFGGGYVRAARSIPWGLQRSGALAIQLIIALALGSVWYLRLRHKGVICNPICLLVLLSAVRCICDTAALEYYWLALLIPVAAWECLENRLPVMTFGVSLIVWALFHTMGHLPSTLVYVTAVVGEVALVVYMAREGAHPSRRPHDLTVISPSGLRIPERVLT
jgi:hypothetical protein